jgi:8-oxo-dGTP pyrophosphatase MutT (NUDIX family)
MTQAEGKRYVRKQTAARVFVVDDDRRVLLIKHVVPLANGSEVFWATPGGRIEEGETDGEAAQRELAEELHLSLPMIGPVHTEVVVARFGDEEVENTSLFFLAKWQGQAFRLDGPTALERSVLRDCKWWSADEIEAAREPVYPPGLSAFLRSLA